MPASAISDHQARFMRLKDLSLFLVSGVTLHYLPEKSMRGAISM